MRQVSQYLRFVWHINLLSPNSLCLKSAFSRVETVGKFSFLIRMYANDSGDDLAHCLQF